MWVDAWEYVPSKWYNYDIKQQIENNQIKESIQSKVHDIEESPIKYQNQYLKELLGNSYAVIVAIMLSSYKDGFMYLGNAVDTINANASDYCRAKIIYY